jgi:photosystem II stability/assembly factor-like uncharacterized protein
MTMKVSVRCRAILTSLLIIGLVMPVIRNGRAQAVTSSGTGWAERRPAGNVDLEWYALATDNSGAKMVAAVFGNSGNEGWVYTSADGGATWTVRHPTPLSQYWRAAASDADGASLAVAAWAGRFYTSSNGGESWTERQPAGAVDQRWQTLASDADGSSLIAGASAGRLWISSNGGSSWNAASPGGTAKGDWRGASCSENGSTMLVGNYGGRLYKTSNGGASWTELTPAGAADRDWQATACDADGSNLIVGVDGGRLYTSSDGGSSWTERRPGGDMDRNWSRFASDADGGILLAADGARLYLSLDRGATWTEQRPGGDKDLRWTCCSSADGTHLAVANYGTVASYGTGRLYTLALDPTARVLSVARVGEGAVILDPPGGRYGDGTVVTVTAAAAVGYAFAGWSGDLTGDRNPAPITMDGPKAVTATFVKAFSIAPSGDGGGRIEPGTVQWLAAGASATFRIVPDAGYHVRSIMVDGVPVAAAASYTFEGVGSNHTLRVEFARDAMKTIRLTIGSATMWLDDGSMVRLEVPPVILNARTLLPIRAVVDAVGGTIAWDPSARKVTIVRKDKTVLLWIDKNVAEVNGDRVPVDADARVVPVIMSGRTLLPLRFVAESLGLDVQWNGATREIAVTYAP